MSFRKKLLFVGVNLLDKLAFFLDGSLHMGAKPEFEPGTSLNPD